MWFSKLALISSLLSLVLFSVLATMDGVPGVYLMVLGFTVICAMVFAFSANPINTVSLAIVFAIVYCGGVIYVRGIGDERKSTERMKAAAEAWRREHFSRDK